MTKAASLAPVQDALTRELAAEGQDGLLVAMSGGVDSSTLAVLAYEVLGERMLAVTVDAESSAQAEVDAAIRTAERAGLPHRVVEHSELRDPAYVANTPARCYHCRDGMVDRLWETADAEGFDRVAMGYLPEDAANHAPGRIAAREKGAWFPYVEVDASKADVRSLARRLGIEAADRPANACLSSRIPYGDRVTVEKLDRVEKAEQVVRALAGVDQVRVRHHGDVARIEVLPEDREALLDVSGPVTTRLKSLGFTWVAMDLLGYRTGALNEAIGGVPPERPADVDAESWG